MLFGPADFRNIIMLRQCVQVSVELLEKKTDIIIKLSDIDLMSITSCSISDRVSIIQPVGWEQPERLERGPLNEFRIHITN